MCDNNEIIVIDDEEDSDSEKEDQDESDVESDESDYDVTKCYFYKKKQMKEAAQAAKNKSLQRKAALLKARGNDGITKLAPMTPKAQKVPTTQLKLSPPVFKNSKASRIVNIPINLSPPIKVPAKKTSPSAKEATSTSRQCRANLKTSPPVAKPTRAIKANVKVSPKVAELSNTTRNARASAKSAAYNRQSQKSNAAAKPFTESESFESEDDDHRKNFWKNQQNKSAGKKESCIFKPLALREDVRSSSRALKRAYQTSPKSVETSKSPRPGKMIHGISPKGKEPRKTSESIRGAMKTPTSRTRTSRQSKKNQKSHQNELNEPVPVSFPEPFDPEHSQTLVGDSKKSDSRTSSDEESIGTKESRAIQNLKEIFLESPKSKSYSNEISSTEETLESISEDDIIEEFVLPEECHKCSRVFKDLFQPKFDYKQTKELTYPQLPANVELKDLVTIPTDITFEELLDTDGEQKQEIKEEPAKDPDALLETPHKSAGDEKPVDYEWESAIRRERRSIYAARASFRQREMPSKLRNFSESLLEANESLVADMRRYSRPATPANGMQSQNISEEEMYVTKLVAEGHYRPLLDQQFAETLHFFSNMEKLFGTKPTAP